MIAYSSAHETRMLRLDMRADGQPPAAVCIEATLDGSGHVCLVPDSIPSIKDQLLTDRDGDKAVWVRCARSCGVAVGVATLLWLRVQAQERRLRKQRTFVFESVTPLPDSSHSIWVNVAFGDRASYSAKCCHCHSLGQDTRFGAAPRSSSGDA
jgi:hypothetical protein